MPSQRAPGDQCDPLSFYNSNTLHHLSGNYFLCLEALFMRTSACSWRPTCHPKRRKCFWGLGIPRLVLLYRRS